MQNGVRVSVANDKGVTLMELLVVLAIIGILVSIGVNMMGGVISKQRLRAATGEVQNRLRVAQMLSVVKNIPVTVVFTISPGMAPGQEDSYFACFDNDFDGDCTGEQYINLDTGKTSNLDQSTKTMHPFVEMYEVNFGAATPSAVTFKPPSGLPRPIENAVPAPVNGAVCFRVDAGEDGDPFGDRYIFRRITVDSLVGKATLWKGIDGLAATPDCDSQLPEDDPATEWEQVY